MTYEVELGDTKILVVPSAEMMYSVPAYRSGMVRRKERALGDFIGSGRARYSFVVVLDSSRKGLASVNPLRRNLLKKCGFKPQGTEQGHFGMSYWRLDLHGVTK